MRTALQWIGFCLLIAIICATCGGVTVNGRHYEIGCGLNSGVEVINRPVGTNR